MTTDIYCAECGLPGECECAASDPLATLPREDVEIAIQELRDLSGELGRASRTMDDAPRADYAQASDALVRVADALVAHLAQR